MYAKIVLLVVIYLVFNTYGTFIEDYCWRDYDGTIPSDAFSAGSDGNGQPIYIGQVLFENKLIPGKIHHDTKEIHIEFFNVYTINETIKILCTHHPDHFRWIPTKNNQILDLMKNHILFEGGYEKGAKTYIGRVRSFDELAVGKITCFATYCIRLSTVENAQNAQFFLHNEFEILTYGPNGTQDDLLQSVTDSRTIAVSSVEEEITPILRSWSTSPWSYIVLAFVTILLIVAVVVVVVRYCKT